MDQVNKIQEIKKTVSRLRSPNYPNYTLKDCVGFLRKFYSKYAKRDVSFNEAVIQMGHSPSSSTAPRVVASMRAYGLVASGLGKDNQFLHVTSLGQAIALEPEGTEEWYGYLREAALSDASSKSLYGIWGANLPSEGAIKIKLEKDLGYSPDGAKRFSLVITDNYAFARVVDESPESSQDTSEDKATQQNGKSQEDIYEDEYKVPSQLRKANLLLPGTDREIVIFAPSDLTEIEFDLIFKWLELQKFGLVVAPSKKESEYEQKELPNVPF